MVIALLIPQRATLLQIALRMFSVDLTKAMTDDDDDDDKCILETLNPDIEQNDDCDDVILYPAGGAFNKLRKKQQFLESLLKSQWQRYSEASINTKKEFVMTNVLTPIYQSGRQFKIYNLNHRDTGEEEYTIPNLDMACERIAQKLRDMKKAQTAVARLGKKTKRKLVHPAKRKATAAMDDSAAVPQKRKSQKVSASVVKVIKEAPPARTTNGKKKGVSRPRKKAVAIKRMPEKKKTTTGPQVPKQSSIASRLRRQPRSVVAKDMVPIRNMATPETSIDRQNGRENEPAKTCYSINTSQGEETKGAAVLKVENDETEAVVSIYVPPKMTLPTTKLISSTPSLISNGSKERNRSIADSNSIRKFSEHEQLMYNHSKNCGENELIRCNCHHLASSKDDDDGTVAQVVSEMKKYVIRVPAVSKQATMENEEYVDLSDNDDIGSVMSLSSKTADNGGNKSKNRRPNPDGNVNLSFDELKEIIWGQWEQIDCWKNLCRQYKETYSLQRDIIQQQDKLLASSSTLPVSDNTTTNSLLSIPLLSNSRKDKNCRDCSSSIKDADMKQTLQMHHTSLSVHVPGHDYATTTGTANLDTGKENGGILEEANITICEV